MVQAESRTHSGGGPYSRRERRRHRAVLESPARELINVKDEPAAAGSLDAPGIAASSISKASIIFVHAQLFNQHWQHSSLLDPGRALPAFRFTGKAADKERN
jgi:hypothetical protein